MASFRPVSAAVRGLIKVISSLGVSQPTKVPFRPCQALLVASRSQSATPRFGLLTKAVSQLRIGGPSRRPRAFLPLYGFVAGLAYFGENESKKDDGREIRAAAASILNPRAECSDAAAPAVRSLKDLRLGELLGRGCSGFVFAACPTSKPGHDGQEQAACFPTAAGTECPAPDAAAVRALDEEDSDDDDESACTAAVVASASAGGQVHAAVTGASSHRTAPTAEGLVLDCPLLLRLSLTEPLAATQPMQHAVPEQLQDLEEVPSFVVISRSSSFELIDRSFIEPPAATASVPEAAIVSDGIEVLDPSCDVTEVTQADTASAPEPPSDSLLQPEQQPRPRCNSDDEAATPAAAVEFSDWCYHDAAAGRGSACRCVCCDPHEANASSSSSFVVLGSCVSEQSLPALVIDGNGLCTARPTTPRPSIAGGGSSGEGPGSLHPASQDALPPLLLQRAAEKPNLAATSQSVELLSAAAAAAVAVAAAESAAADEAAAECAASVPSVPPGLASGLGRTLPSAGRDDGVGVPPNRSEPLAVKIMLNTPRALMAIGEELLPLSGGHFGQSGRRSRGLRHPNIVQMFKPFVDVLSNQLLDRFSCLNITMQQSPSGRSLTVFLPMKRYNSTLHAYIRGADVGGLTPAIITPRIRAQLICQLLEAVAYLGSVAVVHRDLKSENILLEACGCVHAGRNNIPVSGLCCCPRLVVSDFGHALVGLRLTYEKSVVSKGGNRAHMPPEVLDAVAGHGVVIDYSKADDWAAGLIALEILTDGVSRDDKRHRLTCGSILRQKQQEPIESSSSSCTGGLHFNLYTIVAALLEVDPSKRIGAAEAADVFQLHLWLSNSAAEIALHDHAAVDNLLIMMACCILSKPSSSSKSNRQQVQELPGRTGLSHMLATCRVDTDLKLTFLSRIQPDAVRSAACRYLCT